MKIKERGNIVKVAVVQMEPHIGKKEANIAKTLEYIELATKKGCRLVVFPELCNTGYVFEKGDEVYNLAEKIPDGPTTMEWIKRAKEHKAYIVAGIAEREGNYLYNSAVIIGPEGYIGKYRKTHLFFEEKLWFNPGDPVLEVFETKIGKIGIMICFDLAFPEVARILALKGADIICHPSNWVRAVNTTFAIARAAENRVFVAAADRIGTERGLSFVGLSVIISPKGDVLAQGSEDMEEMLVAEVNLSDARKDKTINQLNNIIADRRTDIYDRFLGHETKGPLKQ